MCNAYTIISISEKEIIHSMSRIRADHTHLSYSYNSSPPRREDVYTSHTVTISNTLYIANYLWFDIFLLVPFCQNVLNSLSCKTTDYMYKVNSLNKIQILGPHGTTLFIRRTRDKLPFAYLYYVWTISSQSQMSTMCIVWYAPDSSWVRAYR